MSWTARTSCGGRRRCRPSRRSSPSSTTSGRICPGTLRTSDTATLNLCTQIVSIADVYDALRSNRVYRDGLPSDRIKSIMGKKDDPAFNQRLLRRFINLIGLFPSARWCG